MTIVSADPDPAPAHVRSIATVPVSVVMPMWNAEEHVVAAIDQLARMNPAPAQIVLIDDGSNDRSYDLATARAATLGNAVVLRNEVNQGPGESRNISLRHAAQPYVWFCDVDDEWEPSILGRLHAAAEDHGAAIAVCAAGVRTEGRAGVTHPALLSLRSMPPGSVTAARAREELLLGRLSGNLWNKLIVRSALPADPFPPRATHEDLLLVLRLLAGVDRVAVVHEELYRYVRRAGSMMSGGPTYVDGLTSVANEIVGRGALGDRRTDTEQFFLVRWVALPIVSSALRQGGAAVKRDSVEPWRRLLGRSASVLLLVRHGAWSAAAFAVLTRLKVDGAAYAAFRRLRGRPGTAERRDVPEGS